MWVSKIEVTFSGFPVIRIMAFEGLQWCAPILGNYPIALTGFQILRALESLSCSGLPMVYQNHMWSRLGGPPHPVIVI